MKVQEKAKLNFVNPPKTNEVIFFPDPLIWEESIQSENNKSSPKADPTCLVGAVAMGMEEKITHL